MIEKDIIVIGGGGHAKALIDALKKMNRNIIGVLDSNKNLEGKEILGIPVLGNDLLLNDYSPEDVELANAVGSIASQDLRERIFEKLKLKKFKFVNIIHPNSRIGENVHLEEGVQILANTVIGPDSRVGNNTIINNGSVIEHDCVIGEHCHISPGAVLCGGVHLGDKSHFGAGAVAIQGIKIEASVVVGAGAVVIKNIKGTQTVKGNPAK